MNEAIKNKITKFLTGIGFGEWSVSDYFDPENYEKDIDFEHPYDSIIGHLEDSAFDTVEIIGYDSAMAFLQEHDPSLTISLEIANDMGYDMSSVNSEILASILKMNMIQNRLYDRADDINAFFNELQELMQTENEEEE